MIFCCQVGVLLSFLVSSSIEYARLGLLFRGVSPPSFGETGSDFIVSAVGTQRLGWGLGGGSQGSTAAVERV